MDLVISRYLLERPKVFGKKSLFTIALEQCTKPLGFLLAFYNLVFF